MTIYPHYAVATIGKQQKDIGRLYPSRVPGNMPASIDTDAGIALNMDETAACELALDLLENVVSQFSLPAYHSRLKKLTETAAKGLLPRKGISS